MSSMDFILEFYSEVGRSHARQAVRAFRLVDEPCEALETVAWFLFGGPEHAPRVAAWLVASVGNGGSR